MNYVAATKVEMLYHSCFIKNRQLLQAKYIHLSVSLPMDNNLITFKMIIIQTSEPLTTGTLDQGPPPSQIKKKRSVKLRKKINQTETLQKSDRNLTDSDNKDNKFPPWRGPDPKPTDSHRKFKIGEKVQYVISIYNFDATYIC